MAKKRADMDATLQATGASAVFSQDEEMRAVLAHEGPVYEGEYEVKDDRPIEVRTDPTPEPTHEGPGQPIPGGQTTRRIPTEPRTPPEPSGKPHTSAPPDLDVPWMDHIKGWGQPEWIEYWNDKEKRGLSHDETHLALGNPPSPDEPGKISVKGFNGTWRDHNRRIMEVGKAKKAAPPAPEPPAQPTGQYQTKKGVTLSENEGSFTASRVLVKGIAGGKPELTVYALNGDSKEDTVPAIQQRIESEALRRLFPTTPKPIPADAHTLFRFGETEGEVLVIHYTRENGHAQVMLAEYV
jgi:hypothetical protein